MASNDNFPSSSMNTHPSDYDHFQKFGHPGKYKGVQVINNATGSFTASNYGAGALIVGEASTTGHADLSGGGRVNLAHLTKGIQYDFSQTEDKVADPDLEGKIKKRNRDLSLSLNYPAAPWCIFGLTQKSARQSSNKEGDTHTVNTTELQAILIY